MANWTSKVKIKHLFTDEEDMVKKATLRKFNGISV